MELYEKVYALVVPSERVTVGASLACETEEASDSEDGGARMSVKRSPDMVVRAAVTCDDVVRSEVSGVDVYLQQSAHEVSLREEEVQPKCEPE